MPRQPSPDTDAQLVDAGRSTTESGRGAHVSGGLSHRRPKIIVDQGPQGPSAPRRAISQRQAKPLVAPEFGSDLGALSDGSPVFRDQHGLRVASGTFGP
jgi:hypothetical protein